MVAWTWGSGRKGLSFSSGRSSVACLLRPAGPWIGELNRRLLMRFGRKSLPTLKNCRALGIATAQRWWRRRPGCRMLTQRPDSCIPHQLPPFILSPPDTARCHSMHASQSTITRILHRKPPAWSMSADSKPFLQLRRRERRRSSRSFHFSTQRQAEIQHSCRAPPWLQPSNSAFWRAPRQWECCRLIGCPNQVACIRRHSCWIWYASFLSKQDGRCARLAGLYIHSNFREVSVLSARGPSRWRGAHSAAWPSPTACQRRTTACTNTLHPPCLSSTASIPASIPSGPAR
ncbi:hypothetical protein B0J12DRAFT_210405 [Macrophomina phaseolina]|uniref:Uncharacterized protein n=1 Tax=Macrophomina phaseolina TaxID=35725 RepID=A0ABQ8G1U6_9PEZI|nr:hypothetical protein B0J12DRAFT_210405 [Macrophomina phaseolina]